MHFDKGKNKCEKTGGQERAMTTLKTLGDKHFGLWVLWENDLISLCHGFLTYKMGIMVVSYLKCVNYMSQFT